MRRVSCRIEFQRWYWFCSLSLVSFPLWKWTLWKSIGLCSVHPFAGHFLTRRVLAKERFPPPFSTDETFFDVLLFDFPDFQPTTQERFSELLLHTTPEKTATFSEFPRVEEWLWLESLGVTALFSKPFRIRDLLRQSYPCFSQKTTNS